MNHRPSFAASAETIRTSSWLRLAASVSAVVVVLGVAGTGAHALWSQSGTVEAAVTTATRGAPSVDPVSVQCSAKSRNHQDHGRRTVVTGQFTAPSGVDTVTVTIESRKQKPVSKTAQMDSPGAAKVELELKKGQLYRGAE